MLKRIVDGTINAVFRMFPRALSNFSVLPVLHVERLHEDQAFAHVLEFFTDYLRISGHRAVATVIPPTAPILRQALVDAGFSELQYEERLRQLAQVCDIGLHGHYVRDVVGPVLVHNYWNEREIVVTQMAAEIEWLESRGLMTRRIYSGGWWYCDRMMVEILLGFGFEFDFSFSTSRYNRGPLSYRTDRRVSRPTVPPQHERRRSVTRFWAISGVCESGGVFTVPRRLLLAFPRQWLRRNQILVSVYGHDWDMDPSTARSVLARLRKVGIGLGSLSAISITQPGEMAAKSRSRSHV